MIYCLDTNTVVYFLKGTYPVLMERFRATDPSAIRIPEIVRAELLFGVRKSARQRENGRRLDAFLSPFERAGFVDSAADHYAEIRWALEQRGEPIGPNDLLIAATVRSIGATLVTRNTSEFARVDGLMVEDWTRA